MLVIQPPADENDMYGLIEDDNYRPSPFSATTIQSSPGAQNSDPDDGLFVVQPPANENDAYELANDGKGDPKKCQACNAEMTEDAIVCIRCGFDLRSGEQLAQNLEGNSWRAVNKWRLFLGATTSILAGLTLAFVWVLVAKTIGMELVWVSMIIGLACGYQMATVSQVNHYSAGIFSILITMLCLLPEKSLVFQDAMVFLVNLLGSSDEENAVESFWSQFGTLDWLFGFLALTIAFQVGSGKSNISKEPKFEDV